MNATRVSLVIVVLVAAAVWAAGSASACLVRQRTPPTPAPATRPGPAAPAKPTRAIIEVRPVKKFQVAASGVARRNPFSEGKTATAAPAPLDLPRPGSIGAMVATAAVAPEPPPFRLLGMVTRQIGGRDVRTAVISDGRQLWLSKEGDLVAGRYEVTALAVDSATLKDRVAGLQLTIRLQG